MSQSLFRCLLLYVLISEGKTRIWRAGLRNVVLKHMAVGVGAPLILVYFSGDWDVHQRYGILTHGQFYAVGSPPRIVERQDARLRQVHATCRCLDGNTHHAWHKSTRGSAGPLRYVSTFGVGMSFLSKVACGFNRPQVGLLFQMAQPSYEFDMLKTSWKVPQKFSKRNTTPSGVPNRTEENLSTWT